MKKKKHKTFRTINQEQTETYWNEQVSVKIETLKQSFCGINAMNSRFDDLITCFDAFNSIKAFSGLSVFFREEMMKERGGARVFRALKILQ